MRRTSKVINFAVTTAHRSRPTAVCYQNDGAGVVGDRGGRRRLTTTIAPVGTA